MRIFVIPALFVLAFAGDTNEDKCTPLKFGACVEPMYNATFGSKHGLYQDASDLRENCPIIKIGIECVREYAKDCGTEKIAVDFEEQYEKPFGFLTKICDKQSPIRKEYLAATPCLQENSDDLEICSTKVQEFLSFQEADTEEKELTMTCMYEMMLRACLMSSAAEKCGMGTATLIRKALIYSPAIGMKTCNQE